MTIHNLQHGVRILKCSLCVYMVQSFSNLSNNYLFCHLTNLPSLDITQCMNIQGLPSKPYDGNIMTISWNYCSLVHISLRFLYDVLCYHYTCWILPKVLIKQSTLKFNIYRMKYAHVSMFQMIYCSKSCLASLF